jgi:hypothetical protein
MEAIVDEQREAVNRLRITHQSAMQIVLDAAVALWAQDTRNDILRLAIEEVDGSQMAAEKV